MQKDPTCLPTAFVVIYHKQYLFGVNPLQEEIILRSEDTLVTSGSALHASLCWGGSTMTSESTTLGPIYNECGYNEHLVTTTKF